MPEQVNAAPVEFAYSRATETQPSIPESGVTRTLGAHNHKLLVVQNRLAKNWVGTAHSHAHDQAVYLLSGHIRVMCSGQTIELRAGDSFVVAGGVEHQVSALEESIAIDVFTPCRQDFLG